MKRPRLRTMLLVPLIATLAAGTVALGVFIHSTVERDLIATLDDELTRALAVSLGGAPDPGDPIGQGAATLRPPPDDEQQDGNAPQQVIIDGQGTVTVADANGDALASRDLRAYVGVATTATVDGNPRLRAVSVPRSDGTTAIIALSLIDVDASLSSLRRSLVIGAIVLVAAQAVVASLIVRAVNRPVSRLSATAHRIAGGDLHADVGPASGPRETAMLTEDLTAMVAQLRNTIDERERAAAQAEKARRDMERFMADASHELRTPLTAVKGFSELYEAGMLDSDGTDQAMARIGTESERLAELVSDMMRLLRPTDARFSEPVDLAAVASAVVQDLRAAYGTHPLSLEWDKHCDSVVVGDPARLHQAILNLGANACQHTPPGTPVVIRVERRDEQVLVAVVDRGPGIDPALIKELFQPFVRADRSRSRQSHDGAGLGLTIAQRIVEQHAGSVDISATPGGGTTVTLRLPASIGDHDQEIPNL